LEADFGPDPFALVVGLIGWMIAAAATAELRPKVGGLDLLEMIELAPSLVAYGARDVDFKPEKGHFFSRQRTQGHTEKPLKLIRTILRFDPSAITNCAGTSGRA
jgi:hypothetical protein